MCAGVNKFAIRATHEHESRQCRQPLRWLLLMPSIRGFHHLCSGQRNGVRRANMKPTLTLGHGLPQPKTKP